MAASATFALKAGVWFRRGRLVIVPPFRQPSWPLSGGNSTYPGVQIFKTSSVGDLTGPKPFRLSAPITPFCPEAVSPRALGCFRVSQKLGQRDLLWLTRGMLAGGHLFQPAAPSGYSDSSPPNSAPDFMSATLCDRMFRGRRE